MRGREHALYHGLGNGFAHTLDGDSVLAVLGPFRGCEVSEDCGLAGVTNNVVTKNLTTDSTACDGIQADTQVLSQFADRGLRNHRHRLHQRKISSYRGRRGHNRSVCWRLSPLTPRRGGCGAGAIANQVLRFRSFLRHTAFDISHRVRDTGIGCGVATLTFNADNRRPHQDGVTLVHQELFHHSLERRRQFHQGLGGLNFTHHLVNRDLVARLHSPAHDFGFGQAFAHVRQGKGELRHSCSLRLSHQ